MERRLKLDRMLKDKLLVFKNLHFYYQPPENLKMVYPAVIYSFDGIDDRHANNNVYKRKLRYSLIYVSEDPDDRVINAIDSMEYCRMERSPYVADNLYHYPFTIYY